MYFRLGESVMERETRRKLLLFATILSGVAAAYLMYRRGESLGTIAARSITNPVGSLISEVSGVIA